MNGHHEVVLSDGTRLTRQGLVAHENPRKFTRREPIRTLRVAESFDQKLRRGIRDVVDLHPA